MTYERFKVGKFNALGDAFIKNTVFCFDLDLGVTRNAVLYSLHNVIYAPSKIEVEEEMHLRENTVFDIKP